MKDSFFNMAMDMNKEKFNAIREESEARGISIGEARGKMQGIFITLFALVRDGILSALDAAARAGTSFEDFTAKMNAWSAANA